MADNFLFWANFVLGAINELLNPTPRNWWKVVAIGATFAAFILSIIYFKIILL